MKIFLTYNVNMYENVGYQCVYFMRLKPVQSVWKAKRDKKGD